MCWLALCVAALASQLFHVVADIETGIIFIKWPLSSNLLVEFLYQNLTKWHRLLTGVIPKLQQWLPLRSRLLFVRYVRKCAQSAPRNSFQSLGSGSSQSWVLWLKRRFVRANWPFVHYECTRNNTADSWPIASRVVVSYSNKRRRQLFFSTGKDAVASVFHEKKTLCVNAPQEHLSAPLSKILLPAPPVVLWTPPGGRYRPRWETLP